MSKTDQESLIGGKEDGPPCIHPITLFIILKILPIILLFVQIFIHINNGTSSIILILLLLIEFWMTKNVSGLQLVGLKWEVDITKCLKFSYFSKPDPFVPKVSSSNTFWMSHFAFLIIWVISIVIFFITHVYKYVPIGVIGALLNTINLKMFLKANDKHKLDSEQAALAILKDNDVHFNLVKEDESEDGFKVEKAQIKVTTPNEETISKDDS